MATVASTADGLGSVVIPAFANGDTININHDVTWDLDNSAMANGVATITIASGKTLTIKNDAVTYLKWSVAINGPGTLNVGTSDNRIQRNAVSTSTPRATLHFTGVVTGAAFGTSLVCNVYGFVPSTPNHAFLVGNHDTGATSLQLDTHIDLQSGDKIVIGQGTINGQLTESNKGLHTVTNYDAETKIVTITPGLTNNRLDDDVVSIYTRAVQFISTNKPSNLNQGTFTAIEGALFYQFMPGSFKKTFKYLTFDCSTPAYYTLVKLRLEDSLMYQSTSAAQASKFGSSITLARCALINTVLGFNVAFRCKAYDSVFQNLSSSGVTISSSDILIFDSKIKNAVNVASDSYNVKYYDCLFENTPLRVLLQSGNVANVLPGAIIESFNHNQELGAYASAQQTGHILKNQSTDNKLRFVLTNDYPVYRDYPILAPANRTAKFLIALTKDTSGILTKLQIIDPANDPLIDSTATPLAEATAQDTIDNQQIGVAYKSSTPRQLILRISCQNSTGEVLVDTTRIDQSLAKRIK